MTVLAFVSEAEVRAAIPRVALHLEGGGLLAHPTETIYGLGSRPREQDVDLLAHLKGRPQGKPFLLLVSSGSMAERHGLLFTSSASTLAHRFWPGPLTLVLAGGEGRLPEALRGPEGGIAVRWTSHRGMMTLIGAIETPITSTSANRPGEATAPGADAIVEAFRGAVDDATLLVLDGGMLGSLPPSTVVDCTGAHPRLVREGAIPFSELHATAESLTR